ncbi:hypothetical protein N0V90_005095 [Kalmusia sp. IMI 367209]|nr:hypothetical protein N0V90_005095 [Kalmusia sp. IMI 367209]
MSERVKQTWVELELVPFLNTVFGPSPASQPPKWEAEIARAESRINTIASTSHLRNYNDSIINVDRIRLALMASPNLDAEDCSQAASVVSDHELVLTLLVRHAITHGPYPLFSLGVNKNPDAMRERELIRQKGFKLPNMIKSSKKGRNGGGANYARAHNQGSHNRDQGLLHAYGGGSLVPQFIAPANAAAYNQNMAYNATPMWYPGYVSSNESYKNANDQEYYGFGGPVQSTVDNAQVASSMAYPSDGPAYTSPATMHVQSPSPQGRLLSEAPVFIPGASAHKTLHAAPEFIPGAREHKTLSMTGERIW